MSKIEHVDYNGSNYKSDNFGKDTADNCFNLLGDADIVEPIRQNDKIIYQIFCIHFYIIQYKIRIISNL